jgi:hypothetical protein
MRSQSLERWDFLSTSGMDVFGYPVTPNEDLKKTFLGSIHSLGPLGYTTYYYIINMY